MYMYLDVSDFFQTGYILFKILLLYCFKLSKRNNSLDDFGVGSKYGVEERCNGGYHSVDARERGLQDERDVFDLEGPFATTRINTTDETPLEEDVFDDINLGLPVHRELEGELMNSIGVSYFSF